jgi:hypothetical protein
MSLGTSVDTGTLGPFTLEPNWLVTWNAPHIVSHPKNKRGQPGFDVDEFGGERGFQHWFRMAFSMERPVGNVNLPGTSVAIADNATTGRYGEAVKMGSDGNPVPALTLINTSELTGGAGNLATVWFNWLSAPIFSEPI